MSTRAYSIACVSVALAFLFSLLLLLLLLSGMYSPPCDEYGAAKAAREAPPWLNDCVAIKLRVDIGVSASERGVTPIESRAAWRALILGSTSVCQK